MKLLIKTFEYISLAIGLVLMFGSLGGCDNDTLGLLESVLFFLLGFALTALSAVLAEKGEYK